MKYSIEEYFSIENELNKEGYKLICGVDEAGRGPLAGPVFAAAVIMDKDNIIEGIRDSKKLTKEKRVKLYNKIINNALAYSIISVDNNVIDQINIRNATLQAMSNAIKTLKIEPDIIIIDGNDITNLGINQRAIVKGDMKSYSIACASVLAKVARDNYMEKMAKLYPEYMFEKHKGYGTKLHIDLIKKYGPCPIHRKSFLKKILG
ncbi:ribonuclease HII [Caldicellulosiruptoraceae bacterium PP1]